jgi:Zn-dependent M16 (insulinase) family peptidase
MYPFSSTNEKDYRNLQQVYMDAAFKPNLKYLDFLQEGWRLEHKELENKNSDYIFKGVVYNEMKGAFSENSAVFGQKFFNELLPEHTYGFVSGGDPIEIPKLTHEDLVNFHKKYYHPSNSRMYSYGNFDLNKTLDFVNHYLKDFQKISSDYSIVPNQTRWNEPKRMHIYSRFDNMGAPIERQNQIAIGYLMPDITNSDETFILNFLNELLVKGPNSYFYKSLIEPNISGGYNSMTGYDSSVKDTMFSVGLQDIDKNDFEKVETIFEETIDRAIAEGFEEKIIESVLNNIELQLKHQTTRFGLGLLFNLTPLMNHSGDPFVPMNVSRHIQNLRRNLKENPRYLQDKVKEYFKDNKHKMIMTMSPNENYEKELAEKEQKNLEEKVKNLREEDKERIYKDGLALAEAQKAKDDVNCLPCLKIEDIKDLEKVPLDFEIIQKTPLQICKTDTNGIVYFRGLFDASELSEEQRKLLPLFVYICDQFGTKNFDFREFDLLATSKTSGLTWGIHCSENVRDNRLYEFGLMFGSYCLEKNTPDMFHIFQDLFCNWEFKDLQRFEMLLENYISNLSVGIAQSGHLYALQNASGLITEVGKLRESMSGLEHLNYMKKMVVEKKPEEILDEIRGVTKVMFSQSPARCVMNLSSHDLPAATKHFEQFLCNLPKDNPGSPAKWNSSRILKSAARHNIMNIPVSYCAKSLVTVPYTNKDFAPLRVLAKVLTSKYLLPTVREQNGAYGAGSRINSNGIFCFYSYRDPNNRKTLDTFDDSAKWFQQSLKNATIDSQALFEAKLGVLQQLDAPIAPQGHGLDNFSYGISQEIFGKHRKEILETNLKDLERVSAKYLVENEKSVVGKSVIGPASDELINSGKNENWNVVDQN